MNIVYNSECRHFFHTSPLVLLAQEVTVLPLSRSYQFILFRPRFPPKSRPPADDAGMVIYPILSSLERSHSCGIPFHLDR